MHGVWRLYGAASCLSTSTSDAWCVWWGWGKRSGEKKGARYSCFCLHRTRELSDLSFSQPQYRTPTALGMSRPANTQPTETYISLADQGISVGNIQAPMRASRSDAGALLHACIHVHPIANKTIAHACTQLGNDGAGNRKLN